MTELTPRKPEETHALNSWLERPLSLYLTLDWEKILYIVILLAAVLTRFWDLGFRAVSHDESLHTQYSYQYYNGQGYAHTPLMHGPFLFHVTALSYWLFGHSDFTARIPVAIFGVILVAIPYFLRDWIGRKGALFASFVLLISPYVSYYSRYIRHDVYVIIWALIVFIASWVYIRDRDERSLWWFAFGLALMYATKEVSFLYTAIFGSFLVIRLLLLASKEKWFKKSYRKLTPAILLVLVGLILAGVGYVVKTQSEAALESVATATADPNQPDSFAADPNADLSGTVDTEEESTSITTMRWLILAGLMVVSGGLFTVFYRLHDQIKIFPEFDLIILYSTLLLPSMVALAMVIVGIDPQDYTWNTCFLSGQETMGQFDVLFNKLINGDCWSIALTSGIVRSMFFVVPLLIVSIAVGLWWGGNRWVVIAAIFHITFGLLFTSFFTNMGGWATGTLGSLGYWLAQQEVARGSQPWYYYGIVVPLYEFLPLVFTFLAIRLWLVRQQVHKIFAYWFWVLVSALLFGSYLYYASNRNVVALGIEPSSTTAILGGVGLVVLGLAAWFFYVWPRVKRTENIESIWRLTRREDWVGFVPGLIYWFLLTIAAYSYAGEKMPWLSIHFVIPMAFLVGWYFNEVLRDVGWSDIFNRRTLLQIGLTAVVILTVWLALTPLFLGEVSLGLQTSTNLEGLGLLIGRIVLAGGAIYLLNEVNRDTPSITRRRAWLLSIFGLLSVVTIRFSYLANMPNADYVNEFLVYAHGAPATKDDILPQIEELSMRLNGDKGIEIWYDEPWPYTWYLRDYPNKRYFNDASPDLANAPIILTRNDNWGKVDPILRNKYDMQTYTYLWWPMEEYRQLGWESFLGNPEADPAIPSGLLNAQVRSALWDIFWHRDFSVYGNIFNRDFSPSRWPLRKELRLYIRKDVKAQLWDRGVGATAVVLPEDPYAEGALTYAPSQVLGGIGSGEGEFQTPRNIAIGPDDRLYIADSGNHRIQVFENDGTFVTTFGSFGDASQQGTFNEPWGIAVDETSIYVTDTWNHRVQKFTLDGEFVTAFGSSGNVSDPLTGPGTFFGPRDVVLLPNNQLAVTDTGNHRIQIFDRDGNFISAGGGFGSNAGQFFEPVGMAVNTEGLLYLADTWNGRIQELFGSALAPVSEWPVEGWYSQTTENKPYVAVDSEDRIYVTDPEGFRVIIFDRAGNYLGRFGSFGSGRDGFGLPNGLAIDSQDNIFVVDAVNGVVVQCPPLAELTAEE